MIMNFSANFKVIHIFLFIFGWSSAMQKLHLLELIIVEQDALIFVDDYWLAMIFPIHIY